MQDSVFIRFKDASFENAFDLGERAAALVTAGFKAPVRLEMEKVLSPLLLFRKKRYAGMLFEEATSAGKFYAKVRNEAQGASYCFVCDRSLLITAARYMTSGAMISGSATDECVLWQIFFTLELLWMLKHEGYPSASCHLLPIPGEHGRCADNTTPGGREPRPPATGECLLITSTHPGELPPELLRQ